MLVLKKLIKSLGGIFFVGYTLTPPTPIARTTKNFCSTRTAVNNNFDPSTDFRRDVARQCVLKRTCSGCQSLGVIPVIVLFVSYNYAVISKLLYTDVKITHITFKFTGSVLVKTNNLDSENSRKIDILLFIQAILLQQILQRDF